MARLAMVFGLIRLIGVACQPNRLDDSTAVQPAGVKERRGKECQWTRCE